MKIELKCHIVGPTARKTSTVKIVPVQPAENGAYKDPHTFQVPKLRETPKTETKLQSREIKVPITLTSRQKEPPPVTTHLDNKKDEKPEVKQVPIQRETNKREPPKKEEVKQIPVQKEPPKNAKEMPINKEKREEVKEIPVKREMTTEPPKKEPPKKEVKITNKEEVKKFSPEPEIDKVSAFCQLPLTSSFLEWVLWTTLVQVGPQCLLNFAFALGVPVFFLPTKKYLFGFS